MGGISVAKLYIITHYTSNTCVRMVFFSMRWTVRRRELYEFGRTAGSLGAAALHGSKILRAEAIHLTKRFGGIS